MALSPSDIVLALMASRPWPPLSRVVLAEQYSGRTEAGGVVTQTDHDLTSATERGMLDNGGVLEVVDFRRPAIPAGW